MRRVAAAALHPQDAVAGVAEETLQAATVEALVVKAAMPTKAASAMKVEAAKRSHAAICLPLNRPCVARVNARRVGTVAAMAAAMVARSMQAARRVQVQVVSPTRCAPAST